MSAVPHSIWKLSSVIFSNKGLDQPAHPHQQLCYLIFGSHIWTRYERNFNFLASLKSRGDWFENRLVGNPEDRFSSVVASYISDVCSTALGQILQVQQVIIFKK